MEFKRKNRKLLNACSENLDVLGDDCSPAEESLSDYDGEGDDTVQDVEPVQALSEREPNSDNKHTSDDEAVDVPAVNNVGDKRSRIIEPSIPEVRVSTAEESHGTVNVPQGLIAESDAESSNYSTPVLERKDTERTQQDETQHSSDIIPKETEQGKDNHNNHSESDDKKHDNDGHRNKADGLPKQSTGLTEQEKRVVKEMVEEANAETMDASKYVPEVVQIQSPAHVASDAPIVPVHVERSPIGTKIYVVRQEDGEESRFDMRADRLIVKDVTPLAHESTDALPTPSNWGSLDKAKDKVNELI
ncbi:hypothetical protein SARC_13316 [Sphaeroforma arctica JP610]|uniref:Uncharacterized protein n=1 Tax=Sphaeroforma arctica JP610 TaxID=667725 RepID=A0A0L0FBJ5_9EUKA|nr:hypothetical protein SARC_13316 [Sphaeroforma arctica JP610]KNC74127.1 hypothetical protein SARC_13316 [Sphaeroforma arctica JP610]|eukprot:XP_014148029.1 hypothetical protein SARC_13316 [Sphaeroforma arctica JP610]